MGIQSQVDIPWLDPTRPGHILGSAGKIAEAMYKAALNSSNVADTSRAKQGKLREIQRKIGYFDSGTYYFEKLPAPVAVSKTDADGKFTLSLPAGKYVIAATTSRKVGTRGSTPGSSRRASGSASRPACGRTLLPRSPGLEPPIPAFWRGSSGTTGAIASPPPTARRTGNGTGTTSPKGPSDPMRRRAA
jgi:hypothetical protein